MNLRANVPSQLSAQVQAVLKQHPGVGNLSVIAGGSAVPVGDLILADIARESANEIVDVLCELDLHNLGGFQLTPMTAWASSANLQAEIAAPGEEADAVVWTEVTARAYDDTAFTWTFFTFMTLATSLAAIAIVLDSPILVIGAMVLGPDFGPIAAIGLALVRKRFELLRRSVRLLTASFTVSILVATALSLLGRSIGWITPDLIEGHRSATEFIYHPDRWAIVVAILAGIAGVISLTSSASNAMVGVFISVTTIPASGNIAIGLAFQQWDQVVGSAAQLAVNITGMALAGWATLQLQQIVWNRISHRNRRRSRYIQNKAN